ncbi:hypothetical protein [Paenibacillus sp. YIM B09110]|uniref:hypothetical protein n=1 Tax=Paenibacillus sp. YIM B09110 TaxID=3126102 RepID=UPI00301E08D2
MKKLILILLIALTSACSNGDTASRADDSAEASSAAAAMADNSSTETLKKSVTKSFASFPYALVKWNNTVYRITFAEAIMPSEEIGEIQYTSLTESGATPNNFSTEYEAGTKLWSIDQIDTSDAIAIEAAPGKYVKAVNPKTE